MDQGNADLLIPNAADGHGKSAQNAACPLEVLRLRQLVVQKVDQRGMERIVVRHAIHEADAGCRFRQEGRIAAVNLGVCPGGLFRGGFINRFKQTFRKHGGNLVGLHRRDRRCVAHDDTCHAAGGALRKRDGVVLVQLLASQFVQQPGEALRLPGKRVRRTGQGHHQRDPGVRLGIAVQRHNERRQLIRAAIGHRDLQTGGVLRQFIQHDQNFLPVQDRFKKMLSGSGEVLRFRFHFPIQGLAADLIRQFSP